MRLGWATGEAGMLQTMTMLGIATVVTILTGLSLSAIATNGDMGGGGSYFMISRSLGLYLYFHLTMNSLNVRCRPGVWRRNRFLLLFGLLSQCGTLYSIYSMENHIFIIVLLYQRRRFTLLPPDKKFSKLGLQTGMKNGPPSGCRPSA